MKQNIFVSVPFSGRDELDVAADMDKLQSEWLEHNCKDADSIVAFFKEGSRFIDNYEISKAAWEIARSKKHPKLCYLGYALIKMADCDDVIFSEDWETANASKVEHLAYELYIKDSQP